MVGAFDNQTNKTELMRIKIEKLSLNVLESGAGDSALLFLHCWGGSARTWSRVIEKLRSSFRCIAYDHRGWGDSNAPADGYAISDLPGDAASLIRAIDQLGQLADAIRGFLRHEQLTAECRQRHSRLLESKLAGVQPRTR